jgi:hypothetical protein
MIKTYTCTLKPYDVLKGKNALINSVNYAMVYAICKLVFYYYRQNMML